MGKANEDPASPRAGGMKYSSKRLRSVPPIPPEGSVQEFIQMQLFHVVFQPIVAVRTRRTFAYEVLVRPDRRFFPSPPALFDAAVEEGMAGQLGRAIRKLAVEQCPGSALFMNLHPHELDEPWLVQPDDPIFQHTEDLYLEVTESVPLSQFERWQSVLGELRTRGIHLVVDDLGAGYSNLKYISDLCPRVVKLDRELVRGLDKDERGQKLVKGLVHLCSMLGASIVAEGVETVDELNAVAAAGVSYVQGYGLARPAYPPPIAIWPQ